MAATVTKPKPITDEDINILIDLQIKEDGDMAKAYREWCHRTDRIPPKQPAHCKYMGRRIMEKTRAREILTARKNGEVIYDLAVEPMAEMIDHVDGHHVLSLGGALKRLTDLAMRPITHSGDVNATVSVIKLIATLRKWIDLQPDSDFPNIRIVALRDIRTEKPGPGEILVSNEKPKPPKKK